MIWDDKRDGGNLWRSLRRRGKRYNKRAGRNAGRGLIPDRTDISERPAIVARKTRLGDWEGDTVVSAGHKGGLLTLVERKTQLAKITKLPRATARATQKAAVRRLKPIGDFVHTITFDNGKEFAAHQDIAHALKTKIFFATPYHAWERGLNENTNGLIRDFFPKGTDFSTISSAEVAKVERLLNARPRKSLGFRSPQEVFHSLASLKFSMRWEVKSALRKRTSSASTKRSRWRTAAIAAAASSEKGILWPSACLDAAEASSDDCDPDMIFASLIGSPARIARA